MILVVFSELYACFSCKVCHVLLLLAVIKDDGEGDFISARISWLVLSPRPDCAPPHTGCAWTLRTYPPQSVDFASSLSDRRLTAVSAAAATATDSASVIRWCDVIATSSRDVIDSDGLCDDVDRHVTWIDAPIMARSAAVCGFLLTVVASLTTGKLCLAVVFHRIHLIHSTGVFRAVFL